MTRDSNPEILVLPPSLSQPGQRAHKRERHTQLKMEDSAKRKREEDLDF